MNILELKRHTAGYVLREPGDYNEDSDDPYNDLVNYYGSADAVNAVKSDPTAAGLNQYVDPHFNSLPDPSPPPAWVDFYNQFQAEHRANYGIGIDRPWNADDDAARAKQNIDNRYVQALQDYNQKYGTTIAPDQSVLGVDAQPNTYVPKPSSGGWLDHAIGAISGGLADLDSSLGLSTGVTSVSNELANLDSSLGLSKAAPAIIGIAAAYFLPGVGAAIGQSLVSAGIITGAAIPYATVIGTALAQTGISVAQGKPVDQALGDAIISAGMGELSKAYGPSVNSAISQITTNPIAQNAILKAGVDVVVAVAQGKTGDQIVQGIGNSVISSVANDAATSIVNNIPGIDSLSADQQKVVKSGVATSLAGGDGTKAMVNTALTLGTNAVLDKVADNSAVAAGFPDAKTQRDYGGDISVYRADQTAKANDATAKAAGFPDFQTYTDYGGDTTVYRADQTAKENRATAKAAGFPDFDTYQAYGGDTAVYRRASNGLNSQALELAKPKVNQQIADWFARSPEVVHSWSQMPTLKPGEDMTTLISSAPKAVTDAFNRELIKNAPDFNTAFAMARAAYGPNKTFEWTAPSGNKSQSYSTSIQEEVPFDATAMSRSGLGAAAQSALNANKTTFTWVDGKTYKVPDAYAFMLGSNQSNAETQRLLAAGVVPAKSTDLANDYFGNEFVTDPITGAVVSGNGWSAGTSGKTFNAINTAAGNALVKALDVGSGVVKGGANIVGQIGTLAGLTGLVNMDNLVVQTAKQVNDAVDKMRSSDFKNNQELMYGAIAKAGDAGVFAQAVETAKQFGVNPTQLAEFVVENGMSLLVGSGAMTVARGLGAGMTVAEAASLGANALTQGASVAQDTYDQAIKDGVKPEDALTRARAAGAVGGIVSAVANKFIPGALSNETRLAEAAIVKESLVKALKGEIPSELVEEVAGKISSNVANGKAWNEDLGTTGVQAMLGSGLVTSLVHVSTGSADPIASTPTTGLENVSASEFSYAKQALESRGLTPSVSDIAAVSNAEGNLTNKQIDTAIDRTIDSDVVTTLRDAGVPAEKIVGIARQVTAEITSDHDAATTAHNLLDIFDSNNIDPKKANTMAADYSGLITTEQVNNAISEALARNPSATAADIQAAVNNAVKNFATLAQVKEAIKGIQIPAGITSSDVSQAIANYMQANPGLTMQQVADAITAGTSGLATEAGVKTSISEALRSYATTSDIKNAISGIVFPAGLTRSDVAAEIKSAMENHPGLSATDVANAISDYMAANPAVTSAQLKTAVTDATKNLATKSDVETAIKNIQFPAGLTFSDVSQAISNYMTANPGLTLEQVAQAIAAGTSGFATDAGVKASISNALRGVATTADVNAAIAGIKFPAGLTKADVATEIRSAMEANPGLSAADVTKSITDYMAQNPSLTKADVSSVVNTEVGKLNTSIATLRSDLSNEIDAAIASGLSGDAALQKGLDALSAKVGTNQTSLLSKIGATEETLKSDFATKISGLDTKLTAAIAAAQASGLQGDAVLKAAIDSVAATQKTDSASLLKQIGTTEANLSKQFATQLTGLDVKLTAAIADAKAAGLAGDKALQAAIDTVAATQKTDSASLLKSIGTTEANLKTLFTGQLSSLEDKLSNEIDAAVASGLSGDAALQKGLDTLSAKVGTNQTALLAQIGKSADTLKSQFTNQITSLDTKLSAEIDAAIASGLKGDAALQKGLDTLSTKMGTNQAALLTQLGKTATDLKTQFATQISGVKADLAKAQEDILSEVARNEAAGMTRDTALQKAINTVAATQKTDVATLTKNISGLGTTLGNEITALQTNLAQTEKDILAQVAVNEKAGMTRDAALQKAINTVAATQKTDTASLTSKISNLGTTFGKEVDALQADLAKTEKDILAQVAANENAGMGRDAALQKAINTVATSQKTDTASILLKLNTTATGLDAKIAGVQTELAQTEKDILAQVAINEKAGMTRDAALQKAINTVASTQKTDTATLTSKISGLGTTLSNEIDAVQADLAKTEKDILAQVALNEKAGMTRDTALQKAINTVAATQKTDVATLTSKISGVQTTLGKEIAGVQADLAQTEKDILAQVSINEKAGMTRDAALQKAINTVAATQKTDTASILTKLNTTAAGLDTKIAGIQTELAQTEKDILAQVALNEKSGMTRDAALQKAINTVAATQKTDTATLTSKLSGVQTALGQEIASVSSALAQTQKDILAQVAVNEKAGMTRDAALQSAINTVAVTQKTDTATLTSKLAGVQSTLGAEISNLQTGLAQTQKDILAQVAVNEKAGMTRDAALQSAINTVAKTQKTDTASLLTKLGTTEEALKTQIATQVTSLDTKLSAAIADAKTVGLQGDAALQSAINKVAADQKTTAADILTQMGKSAAELKTQFASDISGLTADVQAKYDALSQSQKDAVNAQVQQGKDLALAIAESATGLQTQITGLSADLQTKYGTLTQAQKDTVASQVQQGKDLTKAITDTALGLQNQITGLSADMQSQYSTLTQAQKDAVASQVQQGKDLAKAISDTASGLQSQISGLGADVQAKYNALTAAQKATVDALIQQGADTATAIANAVASTKTQIAGVSADVQAKYDALTTAQKAEVDARIKQGVEINTAINAAQTKTETQIGNLSADLQTKYDALTKANQAIVNSQIQQGVDTKTAIDNATKTTTQQITNVKTDLSKNITDVQTQFNARVDELVGQGKTYQDATQAALGELNAGVLGLQTSVTDIKATQAAEAARLAAEKTAATKAAKDKAAQQNMMFGLTAGANYIRSKVAPAAEETARPWAQLGLTSTGGENKFESVLGSFLKDAESGFYDPKQLNEQQQQAAPTKKELDMQNPQGTNYFNYGNEYDINEVLSENPGTEMLYSKAGGLATPLFAKGGQANMRNYAGGGLNVIHHEGKPRIDFRTGNAVTGPGDGQSDDIPAMLADGEFVFPADVVSALGNGSTKAGSDKLYDMMHSIRAYHRSAKPKDLPPPAKKSPLDYLKKTA